MLSLTISYAAYEGEVMRGAFAGVARGQLETARAYGMGRWKLFRRIWLPQATFRALPTLAGETVQQLKATPLVATITVVDIYAVASRVRQETFIVYEPLLLLAVVYLASPASWCLHSASSRPGFPHDWDRGSAWPTRSAWIWLKRFRSVSGRPSRLAPTRRTRQHLRSLWLPPRRRASRRSACRISSIIWTHSTPAASTATPNLSSPGRRSHVYMSDAKGGLAHTGFDRIFNEFAKSARLFGVAIFSQRTPSPAASSATSPAASPARVSSPLPPPTGLRCLPAPAASKPVYCTNPMSFAAPVEGGAPLVIDQSSSATAFVSIRKAAEEGREIPAGWALDAQGKPTTDPAAAMKGTLLAFGGNRGANIALMVEVLAAGLSGANWSLDAPSFGEGHESPGTGLFVLAIDPKLIDPDFATRLHEQLDQPRLRLPCAHSGRRTRQGRHAPPRRSGSTFRPTSSGASPNSRIGLRAKIPSTIRSLSAGRRRAASCRRRISPQSEPFAGARRRH